MVECCFCKSSEYITRRTDDILNHPCSGSALQCTNPNHNSTMFILQCSGCSETVFDGWEKEFPEFSEDILLCEKCGNPFCISCWQYSNGCELNGETDQLICDECSN